MTGLLFGLYHGDVWRFIPVAVLGFAFSAIALATDSIVPAMIAHFANNACLIALARAGIDEAGTEMTVRQRLTLVALGGVVLAAGAALIARAHRTRRVRRSRTHVRGFRRADVAYFTKFLLLERGSPARRAANA